MSAADTYNETTGDAENPIDGSQLVLYTADADWAEGEPQHDNLAEIGVVGFSLWARFEDKKVEIPLLIEGSWHQWLSLSAESFSPDPADPVSDSFVAAVAQTVDEDEGEGWGDFDREHWDGMTSVEQYVYQLVREGYLTMDSAEPALVIDWCVNHYEKSD